MLQGADELSRPDEHTDHTHLPLAPSHSRVVTPRMAVTGTIIPSGAIPATLIRTIAPAGGGPCGR